MYMQEVAVPAEIENVHAAWNVDGTALLYYGDHEFKYPNATCTGGGDEMDVNTASYVQSVVPESPTVTNPVLTLRHSWQK